MCIRDSISNMQLIEREAALNEALAELEQAQLELQASQLSAQEREELLAALQTQLEGQQAQLEDQQAQLEDLIGVRSRIIVELASALNEANVQVDTDQNTGAIRLSSEVLFNVGQAVLKPEGERFLQRFIPVYMDVLLSEEYADSVSEIIIEGHTDSTGTYIENMELSQNRARAVLQYILSSDFTQLSYSEKPVSYTHLVHRARAEEIGIHGIDALRRLHGGHIAQVIVFRAQASGDTGQVASLVDAAKIVVEVGIVGHIAGAVGEDHVGILFGQEMCIRDRAGAARSHGDR